MPRVVGRLEDSVVVDRSAVNWRRNARVRRWTEQIRKLVDDEARRHALAVVRIAKQMRRVRDALPHGQWLDWIEHAVPFRKSAVYDYIKLAQWAEAHPADFQRLQHLGPSRLYLIAKLDRRVFRKLVRRRRHRIRGRDKEVELDLMTVVELREVIDDLRANRSDDDDGPDVEKLVRGARHRAAAVDAIVAELVEHADAVDREIARALHMQLVTTARTLRSVFHL